MPPMTKQATANAFKVGDRLLQANTVSGHVIGEQPVTVASVENRTVPVTHGGGIECFVKLTDGQGNERWHSMEWVQRNCRRAA